MLDWVKKAIVRFGARKFLILISGTLAATATAYLTTMSSAEIKIMILATVVATLEYLGYNGLRDLVEKEPQAEQPTAQWLFQKYTSRGWIAAIVAQWVPVAAEKLGVPAEYLTTICFAVIGMLGAALTGHIVTVARGRAAEMKGGST